MDKTGKKERNQSDHRAKKELLCDLSEQQQVRVQHQACKESVLWVRREIQEHEEQRTSRFRCL